MLLLVLLFSYTKALHTQECYEITCEPVTSQDNQCIVANETSQMVQLYQCQEGYVCDNYKQLGSIYEGDWGNVDCVPKQNQTDKPTECTDQDISTGFECICDKNCFSGTCQNGRCMGLSEGANCTGSEYCMPNYYCLDKQCVPAKAEGENCTDSQECLNGLGCNEGLCTKYFSLELGDLASQKAFCKSYAVSENRCDELTVFINDTKLEEPYSCNIGDVCTFQFKNSKKEFESVECACPGIQNATEGYCSQHIDKLTAEVKKLMYDYCKTRFEDDYEECMYSFFLKDLKCSGEYAHTITNQNLYDCGLYNKDWYEFFENSKKMHMYWPVYQSGVVDDCAAELEIFDREMISDLEEASTIQEEESFSLARAVCLVSFYSLFL